MHPYARIGPELSNGPAVAAEGGSTHIGTNLGITTAWAAPAAHAKEKYFRRGSAGLGWAQPSRSLPNRRPTATARIGCIDLGE